MQRTCRVCGVETNLVCAQCREEFYCSREHQALDWPNHKIKFSTVGDGRREPVYAPIDGVVTAVDETSGTITVYVAPTDSHVIYSPTDGVVVETREERGLWIRPGIFNVPDQTKTGRLVVRVRAGLSGREYEYWIEVGHGKYITDTVQFDASAPGTPVSARRRIGEILIGSLYEMHLGPGAKILCGQNLRVEGGGSEPLAEL